MPGPAQKTETKTEIHCPKCGGAFEPTALIRDQLRAQIEGELRADVDKRLAEARVREAALLKQQRELAAQKEEIALTVERRVAEEARRLCDRESALVRERCAREAEQNLRQRDEELKETRAKLGLASAREAEMLRKQRELDDREEQMALEFEKRLSADRQRIKEQEHKVAEERAGLEREQQRLRDEEHRETIVALQKHIAELQRRAQQGSQQSQGEAQEVVLRELLADAFDGDLIEDVPKGVHGADVLQRVRTLDGRECGTIAWESKRTKSWSDGWLPKLRDDQRAVGAACAILVTQELPKDIRHFGMKDGVWVAAWPYAAALGAAVRAHLLEVAMAKRVAEGRGEKMQMLYDYLTGTEFKNRVGGFVEAFKEMQEDLEQEKRAMLKLWKRREKQMLRARDNISAFYGDLQGIAGHKLGDIPALRLVSGANRVTRNTRQQSLLLTDAHDEEETPAPPASAPAADEEWTPHS